jgi:hypothetical protein
VLALRASVRRGPVFLARELRLVASTVERILRRHLPCCPRRATDLVKDTQPTWTKRSVFSSTLDDPKWERITIALDRACG